MTADRIHHLDPEPLDDLPPHLVWRPSRLGDCWDPEREEWRTTWDEDPERGVPPEWIEDGDDPDDLVLYELVDFNGYDATYVGENGWTIRQSRPFSERELAEMAARRAKRGRSTPPPVRLVAATVPVPSARARAPRRRRTARSSSSAGSSDDDGGEPPDPPPPPPLPPHLVALFLPELRDARRRQIERLAAADVDPGRDEAAPSRDRSASSTFPPTPGGGHRGE